MPNPIVRPPREAEWPACRMLLPAAFAGQGSPECLLAVLERPLRILGAASFRRTDEHVHSVHVHVLEAYRRQSLGSALLARIAEEAQRSGARDIEAVADLERDRAAEPFLVRNGFVRREGVITAELELASALKIVRRSFGRLRERGRIAPAARVVPLPQAPLDQIAEMYTDYIAESRDWRAGIWRAMLKDPCLRHSEVLLIGRRAQAAMLVTVAGSRAQILALVIRPGYRGSWAAPLLLTAIVESGMEQGVRSAAFEYRETNLRMASLARHVGAKITGTRARFELIRGQATQSPFI